MPVAMTLNSSKQMKLNRKIIFFTHGLAIVCGIVVLLLAGYHSHEISTAPQSNLGASATTAWETVRLGIGYGYKIVALSLAGSLQLLMLHWIVVGRGIDKFLTNDDLVTLCIVCNQAIFVFALLSV